MKVRYAWIVLKAEIAHAHGCKHTILYCGRDRARLSESRSGSQGGRQEFRSRGARRRVAPALETDIALALPAVGLDADVAQHMVTEVVKRRPDEGSRRAARAEDPASQTAGRRRGMVAAPGAAGHSGEAKPPLGQRSRYAWLDPGSCACSPWLVPITCHRIDVLAAAIVRAGSVSTKGLDNILTSRYTLPTAQDSSKTAGA